MKSVDSQIETHKVESENIGWFNVAYASSSNVDQLATLSKSLKKKAIDSYIFSSRGAALRVYSSDVDEAVEVINNALSQGRVQRIKIANEPAFP